MNMNYRGQFQIQLNYDHDLVFYDTLENGLIRVNTDQTQLFNSLDKYVFLFIENLSYPRHRPTYQLSKSRSLCNRLNSRPERGCRKSTTPGVGWEIRGRRRSGTTQREGSCACWFLSLSQDISWDGLMCSQACMSIFHIPF